MNIHLMRLKSVVRELRGIRDELARLGDCWEQELSQQGIRMRPPVVDASGPEPSMSYVDEELDFIRETVERYKHEDEIKAREEE